MSAMQWKITRRSKKQKNMTQDEEGKKANNQNRSRTNTKLANQNIKATVIISGVQKVNQRHVRDRKDSIQTSISEMDNI